MRQRSLLSAEQIAGWRRGEEDAVRAVFESCFPQAVRLGVLSGLGHDQAQDCAQDAFVRAYDRRAQLRDPEAFDVWFHRILTRAVLDALTSHKEAHESLPDDETLAEDWARNQVTTPDDIVLRDEEREAMWLQLRQLPSSYRVALVLRYYHGFSARQVATILGVSYGALRVTLHRALQRLRVSLATESAQRERSLGG